MAKGLLKEFMYELIRIPIIENGWVDALAKIINSTTIVNNQHGNIGNIMSPLHGWSDEYRSRGHMDDANFFSS